ncbi:SMI1/KNR4 family protein [Aureibacter tunicatorum]|uniref:Knr4/Smi1-like domain-containing protein n=1 Tax=Aureibacter tunicatorum TaxID=866807 RepID=A0AAE3XM86_9BACT|nr:SMI1/KNR4 family protein [Aureibacter tunicatorum]MDR6238515.1 hypothetical protein [Aureibacter tunicatorum]BDD05552.1 hypothetical protein AUTU_30350 [Aureibacter tunicatorum]
MISEIIKLFKEEATHEINCGVEEMKLDRIEKELSIKFPPLLRELYLVTNGAYDGGLLIFLSIDELKNINEFDFGYYSENESVNNILWEFNAVGEPNCLIKNSQNYYSFMDYNFGGAYWFINLNQNDAEYGQIKLIYNQSNEHFKCQNTINDFFNIFNLEGCIESLLGSEDEIKFYSLT